MSLLARSLHKLYKRDMKLGFSNYASATPAQQPNHPLASATTLRQPRFSNQNSVSLQQPNLSNQNSPPLASTCKATSYTSYHSPTPSGKHMQSHILHVISKSHPLWQVHAKPHLTRRIRIPTPSGKYMRSHILHVISKPHTLWQVHAKSHLTRHIKIPPPLASTCKVTSYTSYQNPNPSGKYMQSHILHVISKSQPLWQVHAESLLTRSKSNPLWQVHLQSNLTRHIKIPPPLASTSTV